MQSCSEFPQALCAGAMRAVTLMCLQMIHQCMCVCTPYSFLTSYFPFLSSTHCVFTTTHQPPAPTLHHQPACQQLATKNTEISKDQPASLSLASPSSPLFSNAHTACTHTGETVCLKGRHELEMISVLSSSSLYSTHPPQQRHFHCQLITQCLCEGLLGFCV